MKVLDKGFVELEDFMGGDLRVVNSAKVSFNKRSDQMTEKEEKLVNYLMKHRHGTPFEHSVFTFYVKAPLFVVREWQRHRIGSYNEMSGRYVEFEPEFYEPEHFRMPASTNKQGSQEPDDEWFKEHAGFWSWKRSDDRSNKEWWNYIANTAVRANNMLAYDNYKLLLSYGIAREMARTVLPLSLYTEFFWTVNARSLMNFLNLRTGSDAQWEIRQFADSIVEIFKDKMPATYKAWEDNNRLAP